MTGPKSGASPAIDFARGGFWPVTTYDAEGWLAEDKAAMSSAEATPNADGSYTINFNNPAAPNNVNTPAPFSALVRVYVPESVAGITSYFATEANKFVIA